MNPGELRNRVTLRRSTNVSQPDAGSSPGWDSYATNVCARVKSLTANQIISARQVFSNVSVLVTIRFRAGVQPNDQVTLGNRILGIKGVLDRDARRIYLDLMCEELSNGS